MPFAAGFFFQADFAAKLIACVCGSKGRRKVRQCCASLACNRLQCWLRWRFLLTISLMIGYLVAFCTWLGLLTYLFIDYEPFSPFKSWYVTSFFLLGTYTMTLVTIRQHWVHFTKPYMQKYIVRIALFVLSYAFYSVSAAYKYTALRYSVLLDVSLRH